jgi:carboxylesterase type B
VNLTSSCGLRGKVIGAASSTAKARDVYAFLGVPYAEPPTGSLRFSSPRPVTLWSGIRDAKQYGDISREFIMHFVSFHRRIGSAEIAGQENTIQEIEGQNRRT